MAFTTQQLTTLLEEKLKYMGTKYNEHHTMKGNYHPSLGRLHYSLKMEFRDPIYARSYGDYFGYRLISGHETAIIYGIVKEMTIITKDKDDNIFSSGFEIFVDNTGTYKMTGEYVNGFPHGKFSITFNNDFKNGVEKEVFNGSIYSNVKDNKVYFILENSDKDKFDKEINDLVSQLNSLGV
jgi:hypothetical protein